MKRKIVLIDGHNLLFRMYYGIPNSIKREGVEIKGVIGFVGTVLKIYQQFQPYTIIVVFDSETSQTENRKINSEYKNNRIDYSQVPYEMNPFSQYEMIKDCLNFMEIKNFECLNSEADDYIASICSKYQKAYQMIIVSTDKDFMQLINDNTNLFVCRGKQSILYDKAEVHKRYHVMPIDFPLYLSLVGDKVDNIKGIKGVGPKTAVKLIQNEDPIFLEKHKSAVEEHLKLVTLNRKLDINNLSFEQLDLSGMKTKDIINKVF